MPAAGWLVGVIALGGAVAYLLAAAVAQTARVGSPLPAPPLPGWGRRWLTGRHRQVVGGVLGVAAVVAVVAVVAVWEPGYVPVAVLLVLGVPAAYTDARELRLPDELTYTLAATATGAVLVLQLTGTGDGALRAALSGAGYALVLLLVALFAPTGRRAAAETGSVQTGTPAALGLGDIKLAVGLGVVLGWTSVTAVTGAVFLAAAGHLLWLIGCTAAHRCGLSRGMTATALGPWMVAGGVAALALSLPLS